MAEETTSNSYEEARKQQLLENKKRFEELGIMTISRNLSDLSKSEKKFKQREVKPKVRNAEIVEPRRSTRAHNPIITYQDEWSGVQPKIRNSEIGPRRSKRARNPIITYQDQWSRVQPKIRNAEIGPRRSTCARKPIATFQDEVDIGLPNVRRRPDPDSSWTRYIARPLKECKLASYKKRVQAIKSAEKLQSNLQSDCPSFVKSMLRSHVYSCFWLGLPRRFCEAHLPKSTVNMILEDEDGNESEAVFISSRTGLSGGWRAFAIERKIDDGDALVFELIKETRFKIYIVKAYTDKTASMARKKHKTALDSPQKMRGPYLQKATFKPKKQSSERRITQLQKLTAKNTQKSKDN